MAKKKQRNLVIVESPAKARTLAGLLGPEYDVHASVGHVRDLPKTKLGVDIDDGFAPKYVVPREKQKVVRQLKAAAEGADRVYLATDPDREGEAIAWHVLRAAELEGMPHQRVVFHEVTKNAVLSAFEHPRDINERLVDAQQARRILDRLVGYKISPVLWSKVRRGLSAGRVQSVALRMVVEREREITAFVPQEYWTIDAKLAKPSDSAATLDRAPGGTGGQAQEAGDRQRRGERASAGAPATGALRRRVRAKEGAASAPAASLHDEQPAAGGVAAPGLHGEADDGRRAAALRGAFRRRQPGRTHHIHAHRLDARRRERARRDARLHRRQVRRHRSCRRRRASSARRRRAPRKRTRRSGRRPPVASPGR